MALDESLPLHSWPSLNWAKEYGITLSSSAPLPQFQEQHHATVMTGGHNALPGDCEDLVGDAPGHSLETGLTQRPGQGLFEVGDQRFSEWHPSLSLPLVTLHFCLHCTLGSSYGVIWTKTLKDILHQKSLKTTGIKPLGDFIQKAAKIYKDIITFITVIFLEYCKPFKSFISDRSQEILILMLSVNSDGTKGQRAPKRWPWTCVEIPRMPQLAHV